MGYILPITHYQAEQYAVRDIISKTKNYKKEEIYPAAKIVNSSTYLQIKYPSQTSYQKKQRHEEVVPNEKLIAQLTGKGTYFHAQI
ncbi:MULTISPECIES: hypothetical protein [Niallia]|jgi:hypothetical protein|uniref:hypothetical protein n=1 Tax=Niallia TaxID=2837506 RepID=UPI000F458B78|nr:hypothetical protein [Niallia circulans]AYV65526.1 hypothetical protein C2I06_00795 [Niallia circulans]AYV71668.1 hypothetical protein C2H98_08755 [Niallia circulans]NRG28354.1 hypothetical protein [Niallia circulans]QJX61412.1 hypothetical protein HLK66_06945 [Niallia circulans]